MNFLNSELKKVNYFHPKEKNNLMFNNIQAMFLRAELSKIEIKTLWGIFKKLIKQNKKNV